MNSWRLLLTLTCCILFLTNYIESKVIVKRTTESAADGDVTYFNVQINGYQPNKNDDYVSVAVRAEPGYIVKFEPSASGDRVHHILLYGCEQPAYPSSFWTGSATCNGMSHILYAWARNAPSLELPKDVAIPIGNTGDPVQYLVMQIHYSNPFQGNVRDFSGIKLHLSPIRPKYIAQVYLFVSNEPIPPRLDAAFNNMSCYYRGNSTLHPFAFRTHTHGMGRAVSAFLKHGDEWSKIGKRNPQWPQLFQQVEKPLEIKTGDFMAAMCRFDSHDKDKPVPMGAMGVDEMCNFYMMFYRDADVPDPFPYGAYCGGNENPEVVATEYPVEGTTLLPSHPEWEHVAHQASKPFGVVEKLALKKLGDHEFGQISSIAFDPKGNLAIFHRGSKVWNSYSFDYSNQLVDKSPVTEAAIIVAKENGDDLELVEAFGNDLVYNGSREITLRIPMEIFYLYKQINDVLNYSVVNEFNAEQQEKMVARLNKIKNEHDKAVETILKQFEKTRFKRQSGFAAGAGGVFTDLGGSAGYDYIKNNYFSTGKELEQYLKHVGITEESYIDLRIRALKDETSTSKIENLKKLLFEKQLLHMQMLRELIKKNKIGAWKVKSISVSANFLTVYIDAKFYSISGPICQQQYKGIVDGGIYYHNRSSLMINGAIFVENCNDTNSGATICHEVVKKNETVEAISLTGCCFRRTTMKNDIFVIDLNNYPACNNSNTSNNYKIFKVKTNGENYFNCSNFQL